MSEWHQHEISFTKLVCFKTFYLLSVFLRLIFPSFCETLEPNSDCRKITKKIDTFKNLTEMIWGVKCVSKSE